MKNIIIKSLVIGLLLLFAQSQDFSWFSVLMLLFLAGLLYLQPIFKTSSLLFSFLSFVALSLLIPSRFAIVFARSGFESAEGAGIWLFALVFAGLFFLIVGVKNMVLLRRRESYYLLYLCLNYLALFLFFSIGSSVGFWLKALVFFAFNVGLLREFLRFQDFQLQKIHKVGVFIIALIILQCLWAVSLLPLGFANAASLMTVVIFTLSETFQRYIRGTLNARFIRINFLFTAGVMLAIFLVSGWKI